MAGVFHHSLFIDGTAGRLEALLWTVAGSHPPLAALVCHPHPLFGGTMHNKVVYQAAKALHECGAPVLRFNFRGVGLSEGIYDKGMGERDDVRAALDYVAREFPGRPIVLAGFSFGAFVGLRVGCADRRVERLIGMGLPVDDVRPDYLLECAKPKLLLQGGRDPYGSPKNLTKLVAQMPGVKRLVVIDDVDHFFAGKLPQVGGEIRAWISAAYPSPSSP
jgi:alpha/beta superfamily hydrolase